MLKILEMNKGSIQFSTLSEHFKPKLRRFAIFAVAYVSIAFSYSFIGFLHIQPLSFVPEYTYASFTIEILGHIGFGLVAALPLLDFELILLGGASAVLIDTDHFLSSLKFGVSGRPDHSVFFILVSAVLLVLIARQMNLSKQSQIRLAFLAPAIVMSHIAYDLFAAGGTSTFPLFVPFDFQELALPYSDWYVLLIGAITLTAIGYLVSKRFEKRELIQSENENEKEKPPIIHG